MANEFSESIARYKSSCMDDTDTINPDCYHEDESMRNAGIYYKDPNEDNLMDCEEYHDFRRCNQ